jgi:hypothetical protein
MFRFCASCTVVDCLSLSQLFVVGVSQSLQRQRGLNHGVQVALDSNSSGRREKQVFYKT